MLTNVPNSKSRKVWALVVHGGAGVTDDVDYSRSEAHLAETLKEGGAMLENGGSAVEVTTNIVKELESCGLHVAGKGASPNANGDYELDAAVMDGETRRAGAVAALKGIRHPIKAAEAVMQHSPHVTLTGEGAYLFAREHKIKRVRAPEAYYTPAKVKMSADGELAHGTVGAVALDCDGLLAAASSSGGASCKTPGSISDSALIGAGVWADERVAVACTGISEYFVRVGAAMDVSARIKYARRSVEDAAEDTLENISFLGGEGGMIAIDCLGRIAMPFNTIGMKRGWIRAGGDMFVATFRNANQ